MRPTPIAPTLIRLPGEFFPNTLAGTMEGKFNAREIPAVVFMESLKNFLRDSWFFFIMLEF